MPHSIYWCRKNAGEHGAQAIRILFSSSDLFAIHGTELLSLYERTEHYSSGTR